MYAMQQKFSMHGKMKHAVFVFVYQILILNICLSSWVHVQHVFIQ